MADNSPDFDKITRTRYDIACILYVGSTGKEIVDLSKGSGIKYFSKIDNPYAFYTNDSDNKTLVFPVLKLNICVQNDIWLTINENKNDLIIRFALEAIDEAVDSNDNGKYITKSENILFDLRFEAIFTSPETNSIKTKTTEGTEDSDSASPNDPRMADKYQETVLLLSCISHRNRFKLPINKNIGLKGSSTATVASAIALACALTIHETNQIIFQMPDNVTTYNQVIMPPYNLKDMCYHLQTVYGVYKTGLLIYQDLRYLYIIPRISTKYSVPSTEYNAVDIYIYGNLTLSSPSGTLGYYKDTDKKRYVVTTSSQYQYIDGFEYIKENIGNKFTVFNPSKGDSSITYKNETWGSADFVDEYESSLKSANKGSDDKIRIFENGVSNEYLMTQKVAEVNSSTHFLQLIINNVNLSVFTFNKTYTMYFMDDTSIDTKYGGKYRLMLASQSGTAEQAEYLNPSAQLLFAKIEE